MPNTLEELKKRADEAKFRLEFVVAGIQDLIDEHDHKPQLSGEEIIIRK